jgi:hypothetical protein
MDDILYDTSLTIYALPQPTPPLTALLSASPARLNDHAETLRDHLSAGRIAYEREEERAKIGGLRDCTCALLREEEEAEPYGVAINLLYDKVSYRVVFYGDEAPLIKAKGKRKRRTPDHPTPLLLIKASSSITSRFLTFLETHFHAPPVLPLRLPASYLPTTLRQYITDLVTAHAAISADHALLDFLRDTVGVLKLTISITHAEAAKSLRTIDIDIPPETLYQLVADGPPNQSGGFLGSLHKHLHARTGLLLPLVPDSAPDGAAIGAEKENEAEEVPLKLSRLSCAAFALSSEGRIKLSAKAVQAVDAIPGLGSGQENVVRMANRTMLRGLIDVALTMVE